MKKLVAAALVTLPLAGCLSAIYGDGEQVGTLSGKALFQTSCTVDLSTAGQQGLFGTGTIPLHGSCEVSAENRCGEGNYEFTDIQRSNRRMISEAIPNGPYVNYRTYPGEDQVIQFVCKA